MLNLQIKKELNINFDDEFIDGTKYYFNEEGNAVNGVQEIDGKYYYFINNIKQYQTTDGTYYYGRISGTRQYNYLWDIDQDGNYDNYFSSDRFLCSC